MSSMIRRGVNEAYDGGIVRNVLDNAKPMQGYTALRSYKGDATGVRITSVDLAGFFQRAAPGDAGTDNGGTCIVDSLGRVWYRIFHGDTSVKWFGAKGDGVTDDAPAIALAHASGHSIFYPYGTYKHVGYFPDDCEGGIIGEGWSANNGAKRTRIVAYGCTDPLKAFINPKNSSPKSQFFGIEKIQIIASSWDETTGCLGYGLIIASPVRTDRVYVEGFKKSNVFSLATATSAPYESILLNLVSVYSGQHGFIIGMGANVLNLTGYQGKWNGCTEFGVAPSAPGMYDGLYVDRTTDGLPGIPAYTPEGLIISGGDCSYNSRYGWNFNTLQNSSSVFPGYAEYNKVKEARCGNTLNCHIHFATLLGGVDGFLNEQVYTPYFYRNEFLVGGKKVHPVDDYEMVKNPTAQDEIYGVLANAPSLKKFLARTNTGSASAYIASGIYPDDTLPDKNTEAVVSFRGVGNYGMGLGSGGHFLKIKGNEIRLPSLWYQATGTGWNAAQVKRLVASGVPTTGTWGHGDYVDNISPTASPVARWECVAAGTPGVWRASSWRVTTGTTAQRPTLSTNEPGVQYFDTTLAGSGKPIWWNGNAWVDAAGATV